MIGPGIRARSDPRGGVRRETGVESAHKTLDGFTAFAGVRSVSPWRLARILRRGLLQRPHYERLGLMIEVRLDPNVRILRERFADKWQLGFLASRRMDIQPEKNEAFRRLVGYHGHTL